MLGARMQRTKYRMYSDVSLTEAITKIQKGEISTKRASTTYGIPRTTLIDKLHGRTPVISTQGPGAVLTPEEEGRLTRWVLDMSRVGYGQTRRELCNTVKKILDDDGRPNPFPNNTPGPRWIKAFVRRNPGISERTGEALGKERAMVTVKKIEDWFAKFSKYMLSEEIMGGMEILSDPNRLFNCDESGFPLSGKQEKVLAPTGAKNVYIFSNSDRRQITVLACMSSAGFYVPPMLIFPNSRFRYDPLEGAPEEWCVGRSKNGWINTEVFFEWVANHFMPTIVREGIQLPVVLFVDGHSSHIGLDTAEFCAKNKIILYCLPPHASHIIQPCDLSLFRSLKGSWKNEVRDWKGKNIGQTITKMNFASIFQRAWASSTTQVIAANGFKAAGLFPLDPTKFDRSKLAPSQLFRREEAPAPDGASLTQDEPSTTTALPSTSTATSTAPSTSNTTQIASKPCATALHYLEQGMTDEKKWLFNHRLQEGFDLDDDHLYNAWKHLKLVHATEDKTGPGNENQNNNNATDTPNTGTRNDNANNIPSVNAFDKHLRYPATQSVGKNKSKKQLLPHAISGQVFRKYLQDKRNEKDEQELKKRKNKEKREEAQRKKTKLIRKTSTPSVRDDADEEEDNDDDEDDIDENRCAGCDRPYSGREKEWMGCECGRWYHKKCTDIMDAERLSDTEINNLDWQCFKCMDELL